MLSRSDDPEQTIKDLMAEFPHEGVVAGHPTTTSRDNETFESNRRAATVFVLIFAISIPLVIAIWYLAR